MNKVKLEQELGIRPSIPVQEEGEERPLRSREGLGTALGKVYESEWEKA